MNDLSIYIFYLFTAQKWVFGHFSLSMHFTNWRSILSDFLHKDSVFAFPESQKISNFVYFSIAWVCISFKLNINIHTAVLLSFYEKYIIWKSLITVRFGFNSNRDCPFCLAKIDSNRKRTCIYRLSLRLHILKLLLLMLHSNLTIEIFLG